MPAELSIPMPLALLMCDGAHRDPSTGKWTLLGLFNSIHAVEFPTTHPLMVVYLAVTDAHGKISVRFRIIDGDEERDPLVLIETELTVGDPRVVADIVIPIRDVTFPEPGDYRLQVFTNNQFLMERRILAMAPERQ
ncbi:MAG: hypothetical protein K8T89_08055 [Planctomycetes bacterium]|nr:hypothetical protein [Planctomycetota bacterium]